MSELTVGGDKVTDEGMRNLVGHLDLDPIPDDDEDESDGGSKSNEFSPADICSSLIHLKLVRAYRVTTVGMTVILKHFRRLESFECAEETFWAAMEHDDELNSASYRLPLKEIECLELSQWVLPITSSILRCDLALGRFPHWRTLQTGSVFLLLRAKSKN